MESCCARRYQDLDWVVLSTHNKRTGTGWVITGLARQGGFNMDYSRGQVGYHDTEEADASRQDLVKARRKGWCTMTP